MAGDDRDCAVTFARFAVDALAAFGAPSDALLFARFPVGARGLADRVGGIDHDYWANPCLWGGFHATSGRFPWIPGMGAATLKRFGLAKCASRRPRRPNGDVELRVKPLASPMPTLTSPAPRRGAVASVTRVRPSLPQVRTALQGQAGWWRGGYDGSVTTDDERSLAAMSRRIRLRA